MSPILVGIFIVVFSFSEIVEAIGKPQQESSGLVVRDEPYSEWRSPRDVSSVVKSNCFVCQGLFDTVFKDVRRHNDFAQACSQSKEGPSVIRMCRAFLVRFGPSLARFQDRTSDRNLCSAIGLCADDMHVDAEPFVSNDDASVTGIGDGFPRAPVAPRPVLRGAQGIMGDKGLRGITGRRGLPGPQGEKGVRGPRGPRGTGTFPSCPVVDGRACGGRGVCDEDVGCRCNVEWDGPDCSLKRNTAVCTADGDPHWVTFDNARFSFFEAGEFLQYRNPLRGNEYVSSTFRKCNRVTSCLSDVTVGRDKDVITVSRTCEVKIGCGADILPDLRAGTAIPPTGRGLSVTFNKETSRVTITSATTGLKVNVGCGANGGSAFGLIMTLEINEAPAGVLQGMCGNFNNRADDDVDNDEPYFPSWVSRWSVPAGQSLRECGDNRENIGNWRSDALTTLMEADLKGQIQEKTRALEAPAGAAQTDFSLGSGAEDADDKDCVKNPATGCCYSNMETAGVMCSRLFGRPQFVHCVLDCCINITQCPKWIAFDTLAEKQDREQMQEANQDAKNNDAKECEQEIREGRPPTPRCRPGV